LFVAISLAAMVPVEHGVRRHALFLGAITVGALAGEAFLLVRAPLPPEVSMLEMLAAKALRWLAIGALAYGSFVFLQESARAAARAHQSELQRVELERQLAEARLQALRAQIEPHFLFNTIANVDRLYRTDRVLGRKMLADFIAYLGAALPAMRREETTLMQEVALARSYLDVLKVRMGERLAYRVDVPEDLAGLPFPPLALSTLTENAVKHGLNPLPEGGVIEISARLEARRLTVSIADTGAGLTRASGSGSGLANLRARLAALYGEAGKLSIEANSPRGIRATIALPVRQTD
jgi:LytS/YehU family sensor histidine kinase